MNCRAFTVLLLLLIAGSCAHAQLTYNNLRVDYDSAWTYKNLQLIPIRYKTPPGAGATPGAGLQPISLPEAMQKGKAKIKEVYYKNDADVNWLQITNESKQALVINNGDMLSGGKQDRMVGETKIIAPGESDYLKVYCIEKGRWDKKAKGFQHSGSADTQLKKVMDLTGRQSDVWKEIERQYAADNKTSATWPYINLYNGFSPADSSYIRFFTDKFSRSDSSFAGFLAITKNQIINCELFSSASFTSLSFPSIITSLVHYAAGQGGLPMVRQSDMKKFMDQLLTSEEQQKTFVTGRGKLHTYQDKVIHLIVYGE